MEFELEPKYPQPVGTIDEYDECDNRHRFMEERRGLICKLFCGGPGGDLRALGLDGREMTVPIFLNEV